MNLYLINIESYRLIEKEIKKIVKDNNYLSFNMNKTNIKEIIDEASYFSLDDNKKYLVINNATFFGSGKINDDEADLLIKYIEHPNENTVLIFTTTEGLDSRKKIVKAMKNNGNIINPPKLDKRAINNLLNNYVKENNHIIDYNSINYIMDNSYNNLDIMFNELDKILIYYNKNRNIDFVHVKDIVGKELDSNNFHFVNAVVEKKLGLALKILKSLKTYKVDATSLVMLLAREYRLMYYVKNLYDKLNINELMDYLSLQDWQINKLYTNALKYTNKELLENLVNLSNIDTNIKKGIWDKDTALYGFLMEACS